MGDLHEKVEIINNLVSNVSVRIRDFEDRFDAVDNKLTVAATKEKETKEILTLMTNRILSLERRVLENNQRINSFESNENSPQQSRQSAVNLSFQDESSEAIELRKIGSDSQREYLSTAKNIYLLLSSPSGHRNVESTFKKRYFITLYNH